ncbi:hypothetical protein FJY94_05380 [Candidatus Kaiserbacteria bacterium]|nr:hypothetical protein [Candidatus Kaiserbacteria bacterium]
MTRRKHMASIGKRPGWYSNHAMGYRDDFRGKRVTMMGLGLLGRGVGDAAFLAAQGAQVLVTDKKTEEQLASSLEQLKGCSGITYRLGGHDERDFTDTDMVIKAAGVAVDSPYIAAAKAAGVPVYMSTALAAKYAREAGAVIIGVTGTRGKSTVTHLIHHALCAVGKTAHLGGNIRGVSTLALLPVIRSGDVLVLELDSWQLQGFGDLMISPDIAVFSNLMPDHQNYYPDMEAYFADKANIFKFQREGDALVIGESVREQVAPARPPAAPQVPEPIPDDWQLKIPGEHNRENAALAAAALRAAALTDDDIRRALASFTGVEGRLQLAAEHNGLSIYNDNNATTPEATIAALKALDGGAHNIVLIMGGADKGLALDGLIQEVHTHCKDVILLAGTGTERIRDHFPHAPVCTSLEQAVHEMRMRATTGDIALFSPAFASFGMFANEYERNDRFLALVRPAA